MAEDVRDNVDRSRFEMEVDGHLAFADYRLADGILTFLHTEVPAALAGRGVGSRLVRGALDQARMRGLKVASQCSFVTGYLSKRPEYADLVV